MACRVRFGILCIDETMLTDREVQGRSDLSAEFSRGNLYCTDSALGIRLPICTVRT